MFVSEVEGVGLGASNEDLQWEGHVGDFIVVVAVPRHTNNTRTRARQEYVEMRSTSSSVHPDCHAVVVGALGECCDERKAAVWLHRRFGLVAFYQSAYTGGSRGRLRASTC